MRATAPLCQKASHGSALVAVIERVETLETLLGTIEGSKR
jgi:hypothetical protein